MPSKNVYHVIRLESMKDMDSGIASGDVVRMKGLRIFISIFMCPYCNESWERGGHKEGFVKAAAAAHVWTCFQAELYVRGFVASDYVVCPGYKITSIPEQEAFEDAQERRWYTLSRARGAYYRRRAKDKARGIRPVLGDS